MGASDEDWFDWNIVINDGLDMDLSDNFLRRFQKLTNL
jgi:hypothetical protein